MEKFTEKEIEQLKKLQAKQKRINREKQEFKKQVLANKEEVKEWLNEEPNHEKELTITAEKYNMDRPTFLKIMSDENVVEQIKNWLIQFSQN